MAIENENERTNTPDSTSEKNVELHREFISNVEESVAAESERRRQWVEDIEFAEVPGAQTDEKTAAIRKNRPNYEINKIALSVNQTLGDMRQNQVSVNVRPANSDATLETASVMSGLIRQIENASNFSGIKNISAKESFTGGFGAWQIVTQYTDEDSFDQEIKIKPIHSAGTSVYFSTSSTDEFHQDSEWCVVIHEVSNDKFEQLYGKETAKSSISGEYFETSDWQEREHVRIADYWKKEPYNKTIVQFSDGTSKELDKDLEKVMDELVSNGITEVKRRTVKSNKIVHYKISGSEILEGPHPFPGKIIPVIPVYGYRTWLDGNHYYRGMVRMAKPAQLLFNYATSSKVEQTAVSLNLKPLVTKRMLAGNEASWEDPNPITPRVFTPDPLVPGGAPIPPSAPPVNNALIEQIIQADNDLLATLGQSSQSRGFNPGEQSGKALGFQKAQADLGTFELQDNLARSIEFTGEVLLGMIPETYDTPRAVRILGEDGASAMANINTTIRDTQTGEEVIVENDIALGKYDILTDIGPSFKTRRAEAAEQMAFVMQTTPDNSQILMDLWLESLDSPIAQEASKRLRWPLVQQGIVEPNEEEAARLQQEAEAKAQQGPDPVEVLSLQQLEANTQKAQLDVQQQQIDLEKSTAMAQYEIDEADKQVDKTESETVKNLASADKLEKEANEPKEKPKASK